MRYRRVSSYLDVLDAQRGLFGAELALTQAERDQLSPRCSCIAPWERVARRPGVP